MLCNNEEMIVRGFAFQFLQATLHSVIECRVEEMSKTVLNLQIWIEWEVTDYVAALTEVLRGENRGST